MVAIWSTLNLIYRKQLNQINIKQNGIIILNENIVILNGKRKK